MSGIKSDVRESVLYLNLKDEEIIYPCGHNVIFFNTVDRGQRYIQGIEGTQGVTALALTASKKILAIAEKHEKAPIVSLYDTTTLKRKKKYLVSTDMGKQAEIISMAFAPTNEKFLITLTNEPD
jgi:hypothetical protein